MKRVCIILIFSLPFIACKKNELEDVTIGENVWETNNDYIEVTKQQEVSGTILYLDVIVYDNKLPSNINYTHLHFIDPAGREFITTKRKNIAVRKNPNPPNIYHIAVYDDSLKVRSAPIIYEYIP